MKPRTRPPTGKLLIRGCLGVLCWGLLLTALLPAQSSPFIVRYTDFVDERSGTGGMAKCLAQIPGIQAVKIDLSRPETLDLDRCDMVLLSSFIEKHPRWNAFWRAKKDEVHDFVRRGGVWVAFCRFRKADDTDSHHYRLRLEPPGYELRRGKRDPKIVYIDGNAHPIWATIGGRGNRRGFKSIKCKRVGNFDGFASDCFTSWNKKWRPAVSSEENFNGGADTCALHAKYGRGEMMFLQMVLDKADENAHRVAENLSKDFFRQLFAWSMKRPRMPKKAKKPVVAPPVEVKDPNPNGSGKPDIPVPPPQKIYDRLTVSGRVFEDHNANGVFDAGDQAVLGARLSDQVAVWTTGNDGMFRADLARTAGRLLYLELPARSEMRTGRSWFWPVPLPDTRSRVTLDFPLVPRVAAPTDEERILCIEVPEMKDLAGRDRFVGALQDLIREQAPHDVVVFCPDSRRAELLRHRFTIDKVLKKPSLRVRFASPAGGALVGVGDSPMAGPQRSSTKLIRGELVLLGGVRPPAPWRLWVGRHGPSAVLLSGVPLRDDQVRFLAGRSVVSTRGSAKSPLVFEVPSLFEGNGSPRALLVRVRTTGAPTFEAVGKPIEIPMAGQPTAGGGKDEGAEPDKPIENEDSGLPPHPLVQGSLEAALEKALGGN